MLKNELEKILAGTDLTADEMGGALDKIASGKVPAVQIGAFLGALRSKGESESELVGAARLLRRKCRFIDHGATEVIDTCGTGGDRRDGRSTFNISTTCAFVAAGAGVGVAKSSVSLASYTPSSWAEALAGLISGPSMLKIVRTPSSRRYCATVPMTGCSFAAKRKPIPLSMMESSTASAGASRL